MSGPILVDRDIGWLMTVPKPISDSNWRRRLLPPPEGRIDCRGRLDLDDLPDGGPLGGSLHVYSRRNLREEVSGDWSVGLVYTDYAGNSYRVVRCNGPHQTPHTNRIEGQHIVATPHVHFLTERYQRHRRASPDGYAEATDAYSTIEESLDHLATLVNLVPSGILFL